MHLKTPRRAAPLSRSVVLLAALAVPLGACSTLDALNPWSGKPEELEVKQDPSTIPVEELYNRGIDALNRQNYGTAVQQFDQIEQNYPYSTWTVNAQLMQGYAEYLRNHYTDAIGVLDRFIQLHPAHRDIAYAYYLRALCYYEQIADIRRDQKATQEAMGALQEVVNRFPDSAYARDARLKIDLARDHLAGKEMEVGRYYQRQRLYTAAIGRFQRVVDDFQTTNHVPEALHRLTEIYLTLGLVDQARKTAAVLGHNYPGSEWYEDSYNDLTRSGEVDQAGNPTTAPQSKPGFFGRVFGTTF
ncbi:Outer membrane protein assembly factor BamD [Rhodovastum atsumiense]|uniref:Outer membrane protein assembly factor BamD n=1 Tax=Rhodovastum atsumiense TaxID=504468 RepID=A0A5M6IZ63_9PROT|nr:outer membrane protein assembly factor BamD [Rhodovastum atsumiense]CAH2599493.1 Outer membrane protein assembly factor BamD [Rhodovastum atsumiense]